jgi:hypothetical protein
MNDILQIVLFAAVFIFLQGWLLPRLGVPS